MMHHSDKPMSNDDLKRLGFEVSDPQELLRQKYDALGATGRFPEGKLSDDDEGEIHFGIAHDKEGNVHMDFGKPVRWVACTPDQAQDIADSLLKHARKARKLREKEET
jgi:hypothetical protein